MGGDCLEFENPIRDAISRVRFASESNNLLISSWDSNLRLYDVDNGRVRLEAQAEAALLDCCFESKSTAYSAGSDGSIARYDLHMGSYDRIGNHDDLATCVEYCIETSQAISAGWDRKIMSWDIRTAKALQHLASLNSKVESMSLCRYNLMVAAGESVNIFDLRYLHRPVRGEESCMNLRIKCISSIPGCCDGFAVGAVDGRVSLNNLSFSGSNSTGYMFRCHPKIAKRRDYLVTVNDIVFHPDTCGIFVTGNNEGYVAAWDAQRQRRLFEFARCPNSVASLSYNNRGQLLAVASSYTYQEANEIEDPPQIFILQADPCNLNSELAGSSGLKIATHYMA